MKQDNFILIFLSKLALTIGTLCIGACIVAYPVMWLWNYLMPHLFELPRINFFESLAMAVLCGLLFKGNTYQKR